MKSIGVFLRGITAHHSLLRSRVHSRNYAHHEIRQGGSFMTNNVVKDNGNKEAQCDMVMRLYFRAMAASVVVASCLVFLWDKRCLLETGGRFCQSSKEVLWLQYSVSSASDHLSCMDPVNFPQSSCRLHLYSRSTAEVFTRQSKGSVLDNLGRWSHHRTNVLWWQLLSVDRGYSLSILSNAFFFLNGHQKNLLSFYGPLWNVIYFGVRIEWHDILQHCIAIAFSFHCDWISKTIFWNRFFLLHIQLSYMLSCENVTFVCPAPWLRHAWKCLRMIKLIIALKTSMMSLASSIVSAFCSK